jgi:molybdopterin molybdotransferase
MSLLPVAEAVARIVAGVAPLAVETVPLTEAAGRVLAEDLAARRSRPPFPASAMDGYALRAADATLARSSPSSANAPPGRSFAGKVSPGRVRIFTGAPVPEGADTILIQEDAEALPTAIRVREAAIPAATSAAPASTSPGRHFPRRCRLGFATVSLAAAMGYTRAVRRRPRVALIATGDGWSRPAPSRPRPDRRLNASASPPWSRPRRRAARSRHRPRRCRRHSPLSSAALSPVRRRCRHPRRRLGRRA